MKPKGLGRGLSALLPDADEGAAAPEARSVPVQDIIPNRLQPRRNFAEEELEGLAESIRKSGILQPLLVRVADGRYELIAGERRLRAARLAGLDAVPVRVIEVGSDAEMLELSLVENLQRDDLNPVELAEGYHRLSDQFKLTQEQIAQRVGKKRATVANTLRLLDLPPTIITSLRKGEITTGHAKAILSLNGAARQSGLWKRITASGLSVRQAEADARRTAPARVPRRKSEQSLPPELQVYTDRLRHALGTQVHIARKSGKGSIRIEFYSDDDLARIIEALTGK